MEVELHDGRILEFPDGTDQAVIQGTVKKVLGIQAQEAPVNRPSTGDMFKRELLNSVPVGIARGVKDIIDTGAEYLSRLGGPKEAARVKAMNDAGDAEFEKWGGSTTGRIMGNVLGTAPVGPVLGAAAKGVGATRFGNALASSGFTTGAPAKAGDMALRLFGGAVTGGASAGLVDPQSAQLGATIGGVLPPVAKLVGSAVSAGGAATARAAVPGAIEARGAGYVIPPTQVKPTLTNRLMEGFAGKITTAQNASAKNQPITNELARKAIGADELTKIGIQTVRDKANAAYSQLAAVGAFQVDDSFRESVRAAAGRKALPGLSNREVDELVDGLAGQSMLDAQQTVESIKLLRYQGSANRSAADPAKRTLGSAQMKIAGALEDLIDRNLREAPDLLANYRSARTTLAKVHDVEKALNEASGNVDAQKLAQLLKKGRPLSGELRTVAEFASRFPKAAQMPEKMGSLPQTSPLDWIATGALSASTAEPTMMAGVLARPLVRSRLLSESVQNRLTRAPVLSEFPPLLYRTAPLLAPDQ